MVWQETQSVGVVVMLTQTHELGREKCFAYFPQNPSHGALEINSRHQASPNAAAGAAETPAADIDTSSSEGSGRDTPEVEAARAADENTGFKARVELLESRYEEKTRSTVRKLNLKVDDQEKVIWHHLFEGWPDFSVPEGDDRRALLELIRQTQETAGSPENPRVVHCSAGVGRSGTFIALDYLLGELKDGAWDNPHLQQDRIAETVNELRKQRMMMVQGESQFHFLYEIMKEQWLQRHGLAAAAALNGIAAGCDESMVVAA